MTNESSIALAQLLKKRSQLRWTLTCTLVSVYSVYGLLGLVFQEFYGSSAYGSAVSWGLVFGFAIIVLAVIFSLIYVSLSNRLQPDN